MPSGRFKEPFAELNNLEPGHEYKFRVLAVNTEGESEPLTGEQSIIAKNPFDEPGKPGTPEPVDWDKDRVDLVWRPPLNDGGSPITGYVIEKREKGSDKWIKGAEIPTPAFGEECKATVPNLDENCEYEFRVKAINAAGPGEPSDASRSVITKPRKRKLLNIINKIKAYLLCIIYVCDIFCLLGRSVKTNTISPCSLTFIEFVPGFIFK